MTKNCAEASVGELGLKSGFVINSPRANTRSWQSGIVRTASKPNRPECQLPLLFFGGGL
jgi:hypothetical protein